jgi:ParB family chromosome partitioning protein
MSKTPRGLGAGISALIPNVTEVTERDGSVDLPKAAPDALAVYAEVDIKSIAPNPKQPRTNFDEDAMAELAGSLKEIGLMQPIVVRRSGDNKYEIVAGERRWRAAQLAGFITIPIVIRQTNDDVLLRDALLENLHRAQLNPLEEAAAYQQLLNDFGCTQEELADRIKRSRPQISNTIRLLKLPSKVQIRVAAGTISAGHARALLALPTDAQIEELAARIVAEGLSVRTTEEIVALGGERKEKSERKRVGKLDSPALKEIANRLSDKLETRVKIDMGRKKGVISIEYASIQDLQRIVDVIDGK